MFISFTKIKSYVCSNRKISNHNKTETKCAPIHSLSKNLKSHETRRLAERNLLRTVTTQTVVVGNERVSCC